MEPHTREARTKGIPVLGAGIIYPVPESTWVIEPFQIPDFWPRAYGLDVGWNRTAAIWGAWERQTDCVYIYSEHYLGQSPPSVHADAIKARGWWVPGAIDPASAGSSQVDGRQLRTVYNELGLNLFDADNSVEAGIHACYQRLSSGRLKIFRTCRNLITEMRIYRRDENGKVVKENDHCLAPDTMVHTDAGLRRIADMVGTTGRVLTVGGQLAPYLNCRKTRENAEVVKVTFDDGSDVVCTDDHLFLTVDGWVPAGQLLGKQCYNAVSKSNSGYCSWSSSIRRQFRSSTDGAITFAATISSEMVSVFTASSGNMSMAGPCLTGSTSTTSMVTRQTIARATSRSWMSQAISAITARRMTGVCPTLPGRLQRFGTDLQRAFAGTKSTTRTTGMPCTQRRSSGAITAVLPSRWSTTGGIGFALTTAKRKAAGYLGSTMRAGFASNAAPSSRRTGTPRLGHAADDAPRQSLCVSVVPAGRSDVYCMEVPDHHAFAVEGGVIVHNCCDALRYLVMTGMRFATTSPDFEEEPERRLRRNSVTGY